MAIISSGPIANLNQSGMFMCMSCEFGQCAKTHRACEQWQKISRNIEILLKCIKCAVIEVESVLCTVLQILTSTV